MENIYWAQITLLRVGIARAGLFNDMLGSPFPTDPFKGMVFGMWARWGSGPALFPEYHNNTELWKVLTEYELTKATMFGFWNVSRPVHVIVGSNMTQNSLCKKVYATSYVVPGVRTVVSVASWADDDANCTLKVDYSKLGFNETQRKSAQANGFVVPRIQQFQNATRFEHGADILVQSSRGYFGLGGRGKRPWMQGGYLLVIRPEGTISMKNDDDEASGYPAALDVAPGGALLLSGGSIAVSSTFSEAGPILHAFNLTVAQSAGSGWVVQVLRQSDDIVSVSGKAASFTVDRLYTATEAGRVLVNDTITATGTDPTVVVGVQVRHRAWSTTPSMPVRSCSGPNTLRASSCATNGISGELHTTAGYGTTVGLDAGTGGNPSVYAVFGDNSSATGVGMLALDDVFMAHSETAIRAGPLDAFTHTPACMQLRSTPPSVELADPHFGLANGDSHTLEWAVYDVPASDGAGGSTAQGGEYTPAGYYTFINRVREDSGVSGSITIPKLGPMGAFQAGLLRTDNYSHIDWTKWSVADTREIVRRNGIGHIISQMPRTEFDSPCGLNPTVATGSGFVNENTTIWDNYFKALVAKIKAAEGDLVKVLIYFHAFISGERGAGAKYPADRILNREGQQLNYSGCAAMPLFYPMLLRNGSANAYGQQLYKYLDKAKTLGAGGIYHDESGFSGIPYTFHDDEERWDRRTVAFDSSLAVLPSPLLSSIPLLRLGYKIDFMERARRVLGAQVVANGQPMTRSYVQAQLSSGLPAIHFAETSQQGRVKQTHLYTPIGMNRQPQDSADVDPRFNYTAGFRPASNVVPHLDFGTLSMLGNHLVENRTSTTAERGSDYNVFQAMLPITPTSIGHGFVTGNDRIITSSSGTFGFTPTATCVCLELFDQEAAFVRRWQVSAAQFDVHVSGGEIVVATPSCEQCSETAHTHQLKADWTITTTAWKTDENTVSISTGAALAAKHNVVWRTPSPLNCSVTEAGPRDCTEAGMPFGNGELASLLWVEAGGDIRLQLANSDGWASADLRYKLCSLRIRLTPNPLLGGGAFEQSLQLQNGTIALRMGHATLRVWADSSDTRNPIVVEGTNADGSAFESVEAYVESWRGDTIDKQLTDAELVSAGASAGSVVQVTRISVSDFAAEMVQNGLAGSGVDTIADPQINRTFGTLLTLHGAARVNSSGVALHNARSFILTATALTQQTDSVASWAKALVIREKTANATPLQARASGHATYWDGVWNRSWVDVSSSAAEPGVDAISTVYFTQRWNEMLQGRGKFPIKFQGMSFGAHENHGIGHAYWWQNTRFPYWSMLQRGDFESMCVFVFLHPAYYTRTGTCEKGN
jgi:hypothetical protein